MSNKINKIYIKIKKNTKKKKPEKMGYCTVITHIYGCVSTLSIIYYCYYDLYNNTKQICYAKRIKTNVAHKINTLYGWRNSLKLIIY